MMLLETGFYHPKAGEKIRFLVEYKSTWRPIFWLKVSKDGSVILGPRKKDAKEMRRELKGVQDGQRIIFRPEEGQEVPSALIRHAHMSFHASGIININALRDRFYRDSLRTITEQQELCLLAFQHPNNFSPVAHIEERDICLRFPFDEALAVCANVYVAPREKFQRIAVRSATYQVNLVLEYLGLEGVPDLAVQVVFYHGTVTTWPDWNYLIFGTTEQAATESEAPSTLQ